MKFTLFNEWVGYITGRVWVKPEPVMGFTHTQQTQQQSLLLLLAADAATAAQPRGGATTSPALAPLRRCSGAAPINQRERERERRSGREREGWGRVAPPPPPARRRSPALLLPGRRPLARERERE